MVVLNGTLAYSAGGRTHARYITIHTGVSGNAGLVVGVAAVVAAILVCGMVNRLSWHRPRTLHQLGKRTVGVLKLWTLNPLQP